MSERSDLYDAATPFGGPSAGVLDLAIRIVTACDDEGGKTEPALRQAGKTESFRWEGTGPWVRNRYEKGACYRERRSALPMGDEEAGKAMRNQQRCPAAVGNGAFQRNNPVGQVRLVPALRLKPLGARNNSLPPGLPMRLSRAANSGENNEVCHAYRFHFQ